MYAAGGNDPYFGACGEEVLQFAGEQNVSLSAVTSYTFKDSCRCELCTYRRSQAGKNLPAGIPVPEGGGWLFARSPVQSAVMLSSLVDSGLIGHDAPGRSDSDAPVAAADHSLSSSGIRVEAGVGLPRDASPCPLSDAPAETLESDDMDTNLKFLDEAKQSTAGLTCNLSITSFTYDLRTA